MINIIVYTDGSCIKNNKKPIAGYGIYFPNKEFKNISKPFVHKPITNQRAELYAIYKALKIITQNDIQFDNIYVYTDSMYSIDSITKWIKGWKKNGWITANKEKVKNRDIIKAIDKIMISYENKIKFFHVKSHTGKQDEKSLGNQYADELAIKGSLMNKT